MQQGAADRDLIQNEQPAKIRDDIYPLMESQVAMSDPRNAVSRPAFHARGAVTARNKEQATCMPVFLLQEQQGLEGNFDADGAWDQRPRHRLLNRELGPPAGTVAR